MLSGINTLISLIANSIFDIKDARIAGEVSNIKSNVIEMVLVHTDDLKTSVTNEYCKSLQVIYATFLRASAQSIFRSRGNSSVKHILKSMPILTSFDSVKIDDKINAISSVADGLFSKANGNGNDVVSRFSRSLGQEIENIEIGFEDDIIMSESRGGMPTWIDVIVTITTPGGKPIDKKIPIGVIVKPKAVSTQEMVSFLVKQKLAAIPTTPTAVSRHKKQTFKSLFNLKRAKDNKTIQEKLSSKDKRTFNDIMESCKGVKKPFVNILMSNYTKLALAEAQVNVNDYRILEHLYKKLPIMSFSVYDVNVDEIEYSLTQDSTLTRVTAMEFNSNVSTLEKTLLEGLRIQNVLN